MGRMLRLKSDCGDDVKKKGDSAEEVIEGAREDPRTVATLD